MQMPPIQRPLVSIFKPLIFCHVSLANLTGLKKYSLGNSFIFDKVAIKISQNS